MPVIFIAPIPLQDKTVFGDWSFKRPPSYSLYSGCEYHTGTESWAYELLEVLFPVRQTQTLITNRSLAIVQNVWLTPCHLSLMAISAIFCLLGNEQFGARHNIWTTRWAKQVLKRRNIGLWHCTLPQPVKSWNQAEFYVNFTILKPVKASKWFIPVQSNWTQFWPFLTGSNRFWRVLISSLLIKGKIQILGFCNRQSLVDQDFGDRDRDWYMCGGLNEKCHISHVWFYISTTRCVGLYIIVLLPRWQTVVPGSYVGLPPFPCQLTDSHVHDSASSVLGGILHLSPSPPVGYTEWPFYQSIPISCILLAWNTLRTWIKCGLWRRVILTTSLGN